jgi:hypothetical protein
MEKATKKWFIWIYYFKKKGSVVCFSRVNQSMWIDWLYVKQGEEKNSFFYSAATKSSCRGNNCPVPHAISLLLAISQRGFIETVVAALPGNIYIISLSSRTL